MIKIRLDHKENNKKLIVFGVTRDDFIKMMAGDCFQINLEEFGMSDQGIMIVAGETDNEIVSHIAGDLEMIAGADKRKPEDQNEGT